MAELSLMEQRYEAVFAVCRTGAGSQRSPVARQTVHAWIARYEQGGLPALADRSHRPASCPHQTDAQTEALICAVAAVATSSAAGNGSARCSCGRWT